MTPIPFPHLYLSTLDSCNRRGLSEVEEVCEAMKYTGIKIRGGIVKAE